MIEYLKNNIHPYLGFGTIGLAVVMLAVTVGSFGAPRGSTSQAGSEATVATVEGSLFGTEATLAGVVTASSIYGESYGDIVRDNSNTGHFYVTVPVSDTADTAVQVSIQSVACATPAVFELTATPGQTALNLPNAVPLTCN